MPAAAEVLGVIALVTVLLLIVVIGAAWAPDRPLEDLRTRWATPPSTFLPLQGMSVHLRDEGVVNDAAPILLLHGTSASLHTWDGWVGEISAERRVIRVDLPGFGLTGPFPHDDYSIERYVDFVIALLEALAVPRAIIAGSSFGGQIAWEVAATAPERVAALVLVDATGYPFTPESIPLGFQFGRVPGGRWLIGKLLPRSVIKSSLRNLYGDPALVSDALVDRYYELALREGNRRALGLRFEHFMPGETRAARIPALAQPTLILWGGKDRLIPLESGQRFAREIAGSRLVLFEHLGHVPHEESPQETAAVLREFLAGLDGR